MWVYLTGRLSRMGPLLGLLLTTGCGAGPAAGPAAAPAPVPVRVEVLDGVAFDEEEVSVGLIVAPDSVELRPEQSGLVRTVAFEDGQSVRKGTLLLRLQDADAQAALLDATSRATLARLNLDRSRALLDRADISQAELDRAAAEDGLSRAAVLKATENLRRTTIVAPFDGVMGRRDVAPGQLVDPSRVLGRIEDLSDLSVDTSLPEGSIGRLAVGQKAWVEVASLGGLITPGAVSYVSPRVREDSRTVDIRVRLDGSEPRLRPGMSAEVRIVTAQRSGALLVPTEAVVMSGERSSVWVLGPDDTVSLRPFEAGPRSRERILVRSGLEAGERVIVEGLARLKPGAKATVAAAPGTP